MSEEPPRGTPGCLGRHALRCRGYRVFDPIERVSCRPDFLVLVYPAIHYGGAESTDKYITDHTPPTFLVHSNTDEVCPFADSVRFYEALQEHHIPVEFLRLSSGAHGLGCGKGDLWTTWQAKCMEWLQTRKLVKAK